RLTTRRSSERPSCGMVLFFSTRVLCISIDGDSKGAGRFRLIRFLLLLDSCRLGVSKIMATTMKATMKSVRIHSFGGPDVLQFEDVPVPKAGTNEMLVRVYAAGVNPVDWKIRQRLLGQGPLPQRVIDYRSTKFEDVVHDVDVVLDTMGGDTQERSWNVLKR